MSSARGGDWTVRLGAVGLSGDTEFPHLHFEVRHERKPVDPFVLDAAASAVLR